MMARLVFVALVLAAAPLAAHAQDHSAHDMNAMASGQVAREDAPGDTPGNAPAPAPPSDNAADRIYSTDTMATAREAMRGEVRFVTLAGQLDRLEYRATEGANGYGWEGQLWYGGDIDRGVIASEGEGVFGAPAERVELAAYWRHALDPWINLQAGVRHDFRPDPERTYALVGVEGLAPYWFELTGQLLLSNKGDLHARGKAAYQQRITQSLVLEPEAEVDFAFQDVPDLKVGSGFERIELGARLRYERNRSFAPYLGVHWERKLAGTARLSRAAGDGTTGLAVVFGVRAML